MISCSCICEPQIYVVKNLKPDAIRLKRQMVLNKLKKSSELSSNWFVKLSLQKLHEKDVLSGNNTIFNYETSDLLILTGSPIQASTPHFSNRRKSHKQNILKEHADFSENNSNDWFRSHSLHSNSFKQPGDEFFSTSTTHNRNSLGISLDNTTYSWTSSLATPPCYTKTSSEDEYKDNENTSQITPSKFFARALFSPNGEISELEESAILSSTICTELNENDKTLTAADLSEYSPEASSPVLFEAINNDDPKGYPTTCFDASEKACQSTPPDETINKEDSSLLHSILIKNKHQTSLQKSVHFLDISSPVPQDKPKSDLVSTNPTMIIQSADIHCISQVSGDLTPDYNSCGTNVNQSSTVTNLVSDENKFKINQEIVDCCESSNFNYSFESATLEQNSSKLLDDPVEICEMSRNVLNLDIDKNLELHCIESYVKKTQSKQRGSSSQNNLETVEDSLNNICSQEKHVEKLDSVQTLSEVKLADGVSEKSSERQNVDSNSECDNIESKQHSNLLISCDSNITVKLKSTATRSLNTKSKLKRKTKRFSYPTASQIHQSSPAVKFSFKMQTLSTSNATKTDCSDSNIKLNTTAPPEYNQTFANIESDLAEPIIDNVENNNNTAKDNKIPTNNTVKSDVVQNNNMEECGAVQNNKTVECVINTNNSIEGCAFQTNKTVENSVVQMKNTVKNGDVQTNNSVESCTVQTKYSVEGCAVVQTKNSVEGCAVVQTKNSVEGCAVVQTKNSVEGCAVVQTKNSVDGCAVQINNIVEGCAVPTKNSVEGCNVQTKNTVENCVVQTNNSVEGCAAVQINNTVEGCAVQTKNSVEGCAVQNKNSVEGCAVQTKNSVEGCAVQINNIVEGCAVQTKNSVEGCAVQNKNSVEGCAVQTNNSVEGCAVQTNNTVEGCAVQNQNSVEGCAVQNQNSVEGCAVQNQNSVEGCAVQTKHSVEGCAVQTKTSMEGCAVQTNNTVEGCAAVQTNNAMEVSGILQGKRNDCNASQNISIYLEENLSTSAVNIIDKQQVPSVTYDKQKLMHEATIGKIQKTVHVFPQNYSLQYSKNKSSLLQKRVTQTASTSGIVTKKPREENQCKNVSNRTNTDSFHSKQLKDFYKHRNSIEDHLTASQIVYWQSSEDFSESFNDATIPFKHMPENSHDCDNNKSNTKLSENNQDDSSKQPGQKETILEKVQSGGQDIEGQKTQINEETLQKAQTLVNDSDQIVEKFQGFSTAKGQQIQINEESLQKAQTLVNDSDETFEKFQRCSTAKGQQIQINEESLQKAQHLVNDSDQTVEKFQGFSTAKGQKIKINEESLQKAQTLVNDSDETLEKFQGCSTAKGQKIQINKESLQKVQSLVNDCDETEKFQGFSTAKGQNIQINKESLQKVQSLVNDCDETVEKFQGFSTAKGQKIQINKESLQKVQSLVNDCDETVEKFQGFSTAKGQNIQINKESLQKVQSLVNDCDETVEKFQGFSTAKGQKIQINKESLQKVQSLVNDCDETEKFQGFSTAKGQKIQINKESLQKVQSLVNDCDETEKFQGFSTAKGQNIQINKESLQKVQSLVDDCDETVEKFQGFSTAKGQKIQINKESLQKVQSLVNDYDETVEKFQGFSTAKGQKIQINKESLQKVQSLVDDCDETVEKFQGFSTAKGQKIQINKESLQKVQSLVNDSDQTVEKFQGFFTAKGQNIQINEESLEKVEHLMTDNEQNVKSVLFSDALSSTKDSDLESIEFVSDMQNMKFEESRSLKRKLTIKSYSEKQLPKRFCPFRSPRIINKSALLQNKFSNDTIKNVEHNDKECNVFCEENENKTDTISPLEKEVTYSESKPGNIASGKCEMKNTFPLINLTEKHRVNEAKEQNISNRRKLGDFKEIKEYVAESKDLGGGKIDSANHLRVSSTTMNEQLQEKIQNFSSDDFKDMLDEYGETLNKTQALLVIENEIVRPKTTDLETREISSPHMTVSSNSASDSNHCDKCCASNNDSQQLLVERHTNLKAENILNQKSMKEIKQSLEKNVVNDLLFTDLNSSEIRIDMMTPVNKTLSDLVEEKSIISPNEEIPEQCDQLLDEFEKSFSDDSNPIETSDSKKRNFSEISDENTNLVCKRSKRTSENPKSISVHNRKENDYESIISNNSDISDDILAQSMEMFENRPFRSTDNNPSPLPEPKIHNIDKQVKCFDDIPVDNQMNDDISEEQAMTSAVEKMEKEFYFIKTNAVQPAREQDHTSKQNESEKSSSIYCNNTTGHFVAFQTALGKNVTVSEKSVKCAKQILSKNNNEENSVSKVLKHDISHTNPISVKSNQSQIKEDLTDTGEKNRLGPNPSIFENLQQEDQKLSKLNSKRNSLVWKPSLSHEIEDRQRILPVVTDPIQLHDFSSDKKHCTFKSLLSPNIYQGTLSNSKKCTAIPLLNTKVSDFKTPYRKTGISLPDSKRPIKERALLENKDIESINKPIFKGYQPSARTSFSKENICSNNNSNFKSLLTDMSTTLNSDKGSVSDIEYSEVSGDKDAEKVVQICIKPSKSVSYQELSSKTTEKNPQNEIQSAITVAEYETHLSSKEISRKYLTSKSVLETEIRNTNPVTTKQPDSIHKKYNSNNPEHCPEYSETGISVPCLQRTKNEEFPIQDHKIYWNINSNNINPEKNVLSHIPSAISSNHENKDSESSKSENLICFQKARYEQDAIIIGKKKRKIRPNIGLLMSQKQSERQHRIVEFLKDISFIQYSHEQLFAFGVRQSVLNISSTNAENYHFQLADFYNISYFDKFVIGDGALLVPNDSGSAGKKEFFRSFLTIESVDPNLISIIWFFNHYRWVIWKLASYEVTLPMLFGGRCLSPEMVALQLKYRYDLEIDNCKRSALRKITERDDTPAKRMVLCVSDINRDLLKSNTSSMIQDSEQFIEVTDGWYSLKMILDNQMMNLVANKKIRVGQKLCICKAGLVGSEEAFNPLEAYSQVQLKVSGNCCRPAKWNSRLGYQHDPRPFTIPLSHISQNGGLVGSIDVVIARIYPIMYMEKITGSRAIFRSSHNEHKVEEQYERIQQETLERVYNKVQQSYKENGSRGNNWKPKKFTHKDIAILDNGKDIYEAIVSALHPESIQEYLTEYQRTLLTNYQQDVKNLRNEKIQEELQKALSDENEKNPKRNVVAVLKVRLVGCSECDQQLLATTLLTIWKPTEDLINILSEGSRYRIYNIIPSQARFQFLKTTSVHLSVNRSTHFECLKIDANMLSKIYSPRKIFTSTNIIYGPPLQNYYEVDMAGIVLNITKSLTINQHKLEQLHAVDVEGNIFTICFWGYMQVFSLHSILQEGVVFAARNLLKYRQDGPHSVTVDASTEISDFTLNPQSNHMKDCVNQLKDLKVKEGFLSAAYKKFELEKLSLNLQGIEQKYQIKENVFQSLSSSDDSVKAQHLKMSKLLAYGAASSLSPLASCSSPSVYKAFKAPSLTKTKK